MNDLDSLRLALEAERDAHHRDNEYLLAMRDEARSLAKRLYADYGTPTIDSKLDDEARTTIARWRGEL